jgi:chemotaxis protein methyltransferase CheR
MNQASFRLTMSDGTFSRFSALINRRLGLRMPVAKKLMLQSRLIKRLRALNMSSFDEYYDYIHSEADSGQEMLQFINTVTTNKTDFFREPKHFDFMRSTVLPSLINSGRPEKNHLRIWSVACATGEEPYTLAIVMEETLENLPSISYSILATDISTKVLKVAHLGIYEGSRLDTMPDYLKKKYFLISKDRNDPRVRVVPLLRSRVTFSWLNLTQEDFRVREMMDIIFCRNVMIYFDRETQERVLHNLCKLLRPGGYLFMGHSETLCNCGRLHLAPLVPSVYRKQD